MFYIKESYKLLDVPEKSSQDVIKKAFLDLAKKYHPDSNSPDADINKFVAVENAFRILSKHNATNTKEVEKIVYDIKVCKQFQILFPYIDGQFYSYLFTLIFFIAHSTTT